MISVRNLIFGWNPKTPLVNIPQLEIAPGESLFIQGESGSGKSTLLSLLAGLFLPQEGSITIAGTQVNALSSRKRDLFRARHLGVIFQQFNLIPYLSVIENAELPLRFVSPAAKPDTRGLLEKLGIPPSLHRSLVTRLSAGQQQRVAIARALIGGQEVLIADEPTSALDEKNQRGFMEMLFAEVGEQGRTLIMVSHDSRLAPWFSRVLHWEDLNRV